jgi:ribosomal-protein-alanine N-acetyltransferase
VIAVSIAPVDDVIITARLELVPLPPVLLSAVAGGDLGEVEQQLDAPVGAGWEQGVPAEHRLKITCGPPLRATLAGPRDSPPDSATGRRQRRFHAPPDDQGRVEIGYDIVAGERRKGYAREAIHALLDWAWATNRARTCVASVSPGNAPSLAVIDAFGFRRVGEQIDEIDGLEWVFERPSPWATDVTKAADATAFVTTAATSQHDPLPALTAPPRRRPT